MERHKMKYGTVTVKITSQKTITQKGQRKIKTTTHTSTYEKCIFVGSTCDEIKQHSQSLPMKIKEDHPNMIDWKVINFVVVMELGKTQRPEKSK